MTVLYNTLDIIFFKKDKVLYMFRNTKLHSSQEDCSSRSHTYPTSVCILPSSSAAAAAAKSWSSAVTNVT
jgi:hypothetical protein